MDPITKINYNLNKEVDYNEVYSLDLSDNLEVGDNELLRHRNLKSLILNNNSLITSDIFTFLDKIDTLKFTDNKLESKNYTTINNFGYCSKLKILDIQYNKNITEDEIIKLKDLTELTINTKITENVLKNFNNLKYLNVPLESNIKFNILEYNYGFFTIKENNDNGLRKMVRMKFLNERIYNNIYENNVLVFSILSNKQFTNNSTNLPLIINNDSYLNLIDNMDVNNDELLKYKDNIKTLIINPASPITNECLKELINIETLYFETLEKNNIISNITDDGIRSLRNLTSLNIDLNNNITDNGIKDLTKLEYLIINNNITINGIEKLSKLEYILVNENSELIDSLINEHKFYKCEKQYINSKIRLQRNTEKKYDIVVTNSNYIDSFKNKGYVYSPNIQLRDGLTRLIRYTPEYIYFNGEFDVVKTTSDDIDNYYNKGYVYSENIQVRDGYTRLIKIKY